MVHASLHAVGAPMELQPVRVRLRERIAGAPNLPSRLADGALRELDRLPDGDRLLHGDFHPGNVLLSSRGPVVIDWTNATHGDPDADVARTSLMLKLGAMPPGTPRLIRSLNQVGRGWFGRFYSGGYRAVRPYDSAAVERWMVPHAAARLAEQIPEEVDALLHFLDARVRD
jgi:hypothetical protein